MANGGIASRTGTGMGHEVGVDHMGWYSDFLRGEVGLLKDLLLLATSFLLPPARVWGLFGL